MADISIDGASPEQNKLLNEIAASFTVSPTLLAKVSSEVYDYVTSGLQNPTTPHGPASWVSMITNDIAKQIRSATKRQRVGLGMTINTQAGRLKIASVKFQPDAIVNKQVFFLRKDVVTSTQVFEDIAGRVAEFINSHDLQSEEALSLGVTIDRPVDESLGGGRVADNVDCGLFGGVDLTLALNAALLKRHVAVRVVSATNCVISTLVAAQHRFHNTSVALILNHGINASYYESFGKEGPRVAVNTELARYGEHSSSALPHTLWDHRLDRESSNTGTHTFEKLVADKYLGEIVRNLVTDFMDAQLIFAKNSDASVFSAPYSFFTSYMATMDDASDDLNGIGDLLRAGFNIQASLVDRQIVRALCRIVSMRAAKLVGAAVAGIVKKASESGGSSSRAAVVSISGQLTEINQPYVQCTTETALMLIGELGLPAPTFNVLGEDGYTVGAALSSLTPLV
ncbi:hypothetical protein GGI20_006048 [Coemansia sp. BCRC 34301]|nr:hypothetical protein GGI20_006048 [Coemansia sp. BCRC 34301]